MPSVSDRSRMVLALAHGFSVERAQSPLSAAHVLVGMIREGEGVATTAMIYHGLDLARVAEDVSAIASNGSQAEYDTLLDAAARESDAADHPYLGTEHLLLAILRDSESPVARLLARNGFTYEEAKARILWILGTPTTP